MTFPLTDQEKESFANEHSDLAEWTLPVDQQTWHKTCRDILEKLRKEKKAIWFQNPVDPMRDNIPDYPLVIKHPMDFSTVETRLLDGGDPYRYTHPDQFINDIRQVFYNAMVYNKVGSPVRNDAESLSIVFEKKLLSLTLGRSGTLEPVVSWGAK